MNIKDLAPGQVAWTSPTSLGVDSSGEVWLNKRGECVSAGLPRRPTQSAKVTMISDTEATVQIPITWANALPEINFNSKIKVIGVSER